MEPSEQLRGWQRWGEAGSSPGMGDGCSKTGKPTWLGNIWHSMHSAQKLSLADHNRQHVNTMPSVSDSEVLFFLNQFKAKLFFFSFKKKKKPK